jgi:hypothetical protein
VEEVGEASGNDSYANRWRQKCSLEIAAAVQENETRSFVQA